MHYWCSSAHSLTHSLSEPFPFGYPCFIAHPFNIISSIVQIWFWSSSSAPCLYWFFKPGWTGCQVPTTRHKQVFSLNKHQFNPIQSHPIDAANLHFMLILSCSANMTHKIELTAKRAKLIYAEVWWNMDGIIMCMAFKLNCSACTFNRINIRSIWHLPHTPWLR